MNEDDVGVLEQPVAATVKRGQDGRVDVAPVDALEERKKERIKT